MRPRANTISHVDVQALTAANASIARGLPATHSRHPSLVGLPFQNISLETHFNGMASALGHRGMSHGLPKLETHSMSNMDFLSGGLRTAPAMALNSHEFDFHSMFMGPPHNSTINPNALHYNDSPQSMALDTMSPLPHQVPDLAASQASQRLNDGIDWLAGFEHHLSFGNTTHDNAVDGSSPSAISTTSQSGISDVMLDGSNHPSTAAAPSSMWQPAAMPPPQMTNPFSLDLGTSVFPDLMNGAPVSPQPPQQKNAGETYFSTPPPSLSSLSPSVISGLNAQNLSQTLNFGAGPETPSSMNGSNNNHGTLPVSTITDSTRNAILGALSTSPPPQFGSRRLSIPTTSSPLFPHTQSTPATPSENSASLPSTQDLQRFAGAYLRYFHPHLPFLHLPTLSFDMSQASDGGSGPVGGGGCLLLAMAAIGALYEMEQQKSRELFETAKKMITLYIDERRKANVRKADLRRNSISEQGSQQNENAADTPVWLVQAFLLSVIYGHNCGDKRVAETASNHVPALVSLAQGADLLRQVRMESSEDGDLRMADDDGSWGSGLKLDGDEHSEWLRWKVMEEKKRTLYAVFILSSFLVSAYNQAPALTNSEILLDLPCDEEFFAAESAAAFFAKGGITVAGHNRMTFHEALGELLRTNEKQQKSVFGSGHQAYGPIGDDISKADLKPSSFGSLILINALHNYIWETRQRHHNKVWTNEETEKMHRHIEPALEAWKAAWLSNPRHNADLSNSFTTGSLASDAIPLLDLAYVRLFVDLSRSKEKFWQRDWDGVAEELARGGDVTQSTERFLISNTEPMMLDPSEKLPGDSASLGDLSVVSNTGAQTSSSETTGTGFSMVGDSNTSVPSYDLHRSSVPSRSVSRRERHLRKAAFYAAESLSRLYTLSFSTSDAVTYHLPLSSAMCMFDCAQVLAEWVATLQDRVGSYLGGILGQDEVDPTQVPGIMFLEEDDARLLGKIQEVVSSAEANVEMDSARRGNPVNGGPGSGAQVGTRLHMDGHSGYAARILRVTAYTLEKDAVWPEVRSMAACLETQAHQMRARSEKSVRALD
ncbi:hypothetical protein VTK73DRAFT_7755 [Phialemonium thermophilum]|uniref:Xylanolytic transcriptional activator regulatory domain-containing protein n=1 Tax=Phialemonium thermophilum TaxID=223376 RepID=A0ABR3XSS8_9PEZI